MNRKWILILACSLFSMLVMYRAFAIPFTHDEATTWNYLRYTDVVGCFFNPVCWGSANHHWLNTVLLQLSATIGGDSPGVLRMPNVLAGWLYFLVAALISYRYLKNTWAQLLGFLLMTAHVYLLDFFSLAR